MATTIKRITVAPHTEQVIIDRGEDVEVEVVVGEGARVQYLSITQATGSDKQILTKRAIVNAQASIHWHSAVLSGNVQQSITTQHVGVGAESSHRGLFFGQQRDRYALHYWNEHTAAHTTGTIFIHGVLLDQAYTDFKGNIIIAQTASDTTASLVEDTILLGKQARSDSIPQLDIGTNDVRATHSSAISKIDAEQLFYLASRGIAPEQATAMIAYGFLEDILADFTVPEVRATLQQYLTEQLHYATE